MRFSGKRSVSPGAAIRGLGSRPDNSNRKCHMQYRTLGRTGVRVSPLCMGTMTFGDSADEAESARMFNRCREVGINFFDSANGYASGRSETILGRLIANCRDDV